ncbi:MULTISPECIES: hypothetical protein [Salinibaculum]|uniref:hypothetical protein n=1 Tax=Salinibaculum TaxID=2732368 RepID=UPI0030CD2859
MPSDSTDSSVTFEVPEADRLQEAAEHARDVRQYVVGSSGKSDADGLPGLAGRLIDQAGNYPGKYDPPVALSTHLINVVTVGLTVYVYERVVNDEGEIDDTEVRLLLAALALHDTNKYVDAAYDCSLDTSNNSEEVLDYYFDQGDDFDITEVLPGESEEELARDRADVKWLVQRTEAYEDESETRGASTRRVRGLERYCRISDGFVSVVHEDGLEKGVEWLEKFFADDDSPVQYVEFTRLEQPVLNNHLLTTVKHIIGDRGDEPLETINPPTHGLILGSTPNEVAYLGVPIERDTLREAVDSELMSRITEEHEFNAKTEWRSFEYDILAEVDIHFDEKREIIAEGYAETLRQGSGTDHEFESIPDEFAAHLPELAKVVFRDQNYESAFENYPSMARLWEEISEGDTYNSFTQKIGFIAELLRRWTGAVADGYEVATVRDELADFAEEHRDSLRDDLQPESEAGGVVVDRFFETGLEEEISVPSGDEMCFLCGRHSTRDYKKGNNAFYRTQSFSRRVEPEGDYKKICPVCNLEHALLRDTVEDHDYSVGADIKIAFVYYDAFVANLTVGATGESDRLVRSLQSDEEEVAATVTTPELVAHSFAPQYHLQPIYADTENGRLRQVRELLEALVSNGFKVLIGKPFTGFEPQDALFADLVPTRRERSYSVDRIESFDDLRQSRRLFDILRSAADSGDYDAGRELISLPGDTLEPIADLVVQNSEWYASVREDTHSHFTDSTYKVTYMLMRNVAESGLELYGKEYGSRHKKVKIFRLAVDSALDGLNRGLADEELVEHTAGQVYKAAQEEEYTGRVTTEQATQFVESLFEYLESDDSLTKEDLSSRRNTLANTYLFAYDQLLNELREEEADEEEAPA